jgi:toxin CcdB
VPRYDLYANPVAAERRHTPYLLDVQNEFIDGLATRVVIPLRTAATFGPRARDLNPLLQAQGAELVLDTAALGAIPLAELRKPLDNLRPQQATIAEALDALFGAY